MELVKCQLVNNNGLWQALLNVITTDKQIDVLVQCKWFQGLDGGVGVVVLVAVIAEPISIGIITHLFRNGWTMSTHAKRQPKIQFIRDPTIAFVNSKSVLGVEWNDMQFERVTPTWSDTFMIHSLLSGTPLIRRWYIICYYTRIWKSFRRQATNPQI